MQNTAIPRGDWQRFIDGLLARLPPGGQISMSIDEVIEASGSTDTGIRRPAWWRKAQRGTGHYVMFKNAGLEITLFPNDGTLPICAIVFQRQSPESS